jgi:hypothetical protein
MCRKTGQNLLAAWLGLQRTLNCLILSCTDMGPVVIELIYKVTENIEYSDAEH